MPETTQRIAIHPATEDRFDDLATILNPSGNDRACWCLAYRVTSAEYNALRGADRANRVRDLCGRRPAPGLLAYSGETPIGWCGVGPRARFERLKRSRTMPPVDDVPVWSVICFVVTSGFRRQGVTRALLDGAIAYARSNGAPMIEGYPADLLGLERINSSAAHVGTTGLFEAAGFHRVHETRARADKLPRWLMRLDLSRTPVTEIPATV